MSEPSFFAELKRRNVHRAAVFYAGAGWLLAQVITQVLPIFEMSQTVQRVLVVLIVIGFPVAMALSWFYELTPQGFKRESDVERDDSITQVTGKKLDRLIIAVLSLAVLVLLLNQFVLHRFMPTAPAQTVAASGVTEKSIAVLPLANSTGDPANEYFSDGVSEELISSLSRLSDLKVIGRTSSFQFKGKSDDSKAIGEKLGVVYLLEGSVRKSYDRVRIAVALIKAADGSNVWGETYDREFKDIFAVQSEISGAVASQLKVALLGNNAELAQAPTAATPSNQNIEAYNALLQGNFHFHRGTLEDHRKALAFFEESIRLDPGYALAYAKLSTVLTSMAAGWLGGADGEALRTKARSAAEAAIRLAPDLADAHRALSGVLLNNDLDASGAEREIRRAVALSPTNAIAQSALGATLAQRGQLSQASEMIRQALTLDPLLTGAYVSLARVLIAQGLYDEAEATLRKAIDLHPDAARNYTYLAIINVLRGQPQAALDNARREPEGFWRQFAVAFAAQVQGDRKAADAALQKYIEQQSQNGAYQIAEMYALRKEPDKAFEWLDRAYAARDSGIWLLMYDPIMLAYKDDPRFIAFARKTGAMAAAKT